MKVIVHTDQADQWQQALSERLPDATIWKSQEADREQRAQADFLAAWKPDETLLRECTGLKGIVNLGAGVDALLGNPALPRDVPIVKLRDAGMAELIADYVRYGLFHFQRDFDRYARQQQQCEWREHEVIDKPDWPVGVLGLGAIGERTRALMVALGAEVTAWNRSAREVDGFEPDLARALTGAEVVTLHVALDDGTRGLMDTDRLALLAPLSPL